MPTYAPDTISPAGRVYATRSRLAADSLGIESTVSLVNSILKASIDEGERLESIAAN